MQQPKQDNRLIDEGDLIINRADLIMTIKNDFMNPITPAQHTGRAINAKSSREFGDLAAAKGFFKLAKQRLQNVNSWHMTAGQALAKFSLLDSNGDDVQRPPTEGDHFKIDIPGPGSVEGQGYDWIEVEAIHSVSDENSDSYGFTVRPSPNPKTPKAETAHFYSSESTSTFIVTRTGRIVTAEILDRNIKPNTEAERPSDKVRDTVVGVMGALTFSKIQWQNLTDGLISD